jgi:hypothetical protein
MHAQTIFRTPDGQLHALGNGDIIGRLWSAALQLSSPHISEAHALVSLRGGKFHLLALRGVFAIKGKLVKELVIEAGQQISFARDLMVEVVEVNLPEEILGLEGDGLTRQPIPGVASLRLTPKPNLVPGARDGADAVFWSTGDGWRVRVAGGTEETLAAGWSLKHPGGEVRARGLKLSMAGQSPTRQLGRMGAPIRIETHWDTVHIHREGQPTFTLTGHPARVLSELGTVGTAVPWEGVARQLWTDIDDRHMLRKRFDTVLARMRRKLRAAELNPGLVRPDGNGNFSLVLRPVDTLDDRT